jgi:hypothetical protein
MRPDPNCEPCVEVEMAEHLFFECSHYSQLIWICLVELVMQFLNINSQNLVLGTELGLLNIIYNVPHPRCFYTSKTC